MSIKVLRETHETPEYVSQRLARAGGYNRFGEPNYRVIWGWNRLTPIGGRWEDRDSEGRLIRESVELRMEPKYPQLNRWLIEKWVPPEVYGSPAKWELDTTEEGIPALGPYPSRGEYELSFPLEGPNGEFIQLTPRVVEYIARAIETSRNQWNRRLERQRLYNREAKKEAEYENWGMDVMSDTNTWSYTPHSYLPAHLKEKIT